MNANQKIIKNSPLSARRLVYCPFGSCHVFISNYENGRTVYSLFSYSTRIIVLEKTPDGEQLLTCSGTYSATTRKHIGAFMKEYCPGYTYHDAKKAFEKNAVLDLKRGLWIDPSTAEIVAEKAA